MMPKLLLIVALLLLLSACQQTPVRDEASPDSRISVGSYVVLHQALEVPAGHARVFLQYGRVVAKSGLQQYQPHCNMEVRSVSRGGTLIQPDTFLIIAVMEDEEEVVQGAEWRSYASLAPGGDTNVPMITRFVRHSIHSQRQPEVMRLTCHGGLADPWQAKTPGIGEIRQVLGEIATLQLPGSRD